MLTVLTAISQTIGIPETTAPDNTAAKAQAITSPAKVRGNVYPNADIDYYSFTANAGDKVYAALMTSFSASDFEAQLRLFASDGTTLIEFDEDDGTFGSISSAIAGTTISSAGTYYQEIRNFSTTGQTRGIVYYELCEGFK